jgi:hypothetical protein
MEYEGELDRKAATLAAFALYFPGDYRAMQEAAAGTLDGETALYEFLERLITRPEMPAGGATVNANEKNVKSYGNASENAPQEFCESVKRKRQAAADKPFPRNLPATPRQTLGKDETAQVPLQDLDALRYYTERGIKLIPCIPTDETRKRYRPIVKKEHFSRTATADIGTIKKYMIGGELWTGYDTATGANLHEPITLFRFTPKDYRLVCIDIDRGHSNGADGVENFYKWLEAADIFRAQLPSYLRDIEKYPCRTLTPNGGLHLYFKVAEPDTRATLDELDSAGKLAKDIAGKEHGVEVFYSNPITAAGSRKGDGEYFLYGCFDAAFEYPLILLRRSQKTEKPKHPEAAPVKPRRNAGYPQFHTQTTDLDRYKPRLAEYLHAKGITENADGFISCLCHEDGATPNMKVNTDYLWCFSCNERMDIFDVARILAGIGTDKKDFPKVIKEVQETIGG